MELSSEHVGAYSKAMEVELTERFSMNYASAVRDPNPVYFDDEREVGIVAPPMVSTALTWPLSGEFLRNWEPSSFPHPFPHEVMQQQVLYTETLLWHQVMRPALKLRIQGRLVAILPHRAGTHMVVRYDASSPSHQPVFTEYVGALLRRVRCIGEGKGVENLPRVPDCPTESPAVWEKLISIDQFAAHVFDGCTNMHFPIHTSFKFARQVGLKEPILHGVATVSFALRELLDREGGGDPTRLAQLSCTFTGMVVPGTDILVRLLGKEEHPERLDLFFDVLNSEGRRAISGGYIHLGASRMGEGG